MRSRRTADTNALFDGHMMLSCLLRIKERREERLRRQMTKVMQQQQRAEQLCLRCKARRSELAQTLNQILTWSGTLLSSELIEQKQVMNDLFHEEYRLSQQHILLSDTQNMLQEQLSQLQQDLIIIMKKKEKLRILLNHEC